MNVPISAAVLMPVFAILCIVFKRDIFAVAIASSIFQAASILDLSFGGATIGVPVWIPLMLLSIFVDRRGKPSPLGFGQTKWKLSFNRPAVLLITLFFAYAILSAFLMPFIFDGIHYDSGMSARHLGDFTLHFSTTNIAQVGYLILSAALFYRCAFDRGKFFGPRVIEFYVNACTVAALIGLYQVVSTSRGWYFPDDIVYSNSTYAQLYGDRAADIYRLNATFSEASVAALFFAGSFGIVLSRCALAKPRVPDVLKCLLFVIVLVLTVSTTAYITLILGGMYFAARTLSGSLQSKRALVVAASGALTLGGVFLVSKQNLDFSLTVAHVTSKVLLEKSQSKSYAVRQEANQAAWALFKDTSLLGAGLGSCRASSALVQLLGGVGIFGTGAFLLGILLVFGNRPRALDPWGAGEAAYVGLGLMLLSQAVAVPDLVTPAVWSILGLLVRRGIRKRDVAGLLSQENMNQLVVHGNGERFTLPSTLLKGR